MASRTLSLRLCSRVSRTHRLAASRSPSSTTAQLIRATQTKYPLSPQTAPRHCLSTTRTLSKQAPLSTSSPESDPSADIKAYDFASLSTLVSNPSPSRMIIDVREPGELQQSGRVPGAHNMPINSAPDGLFLPAEDFEDRFGFQKPSAETEVVFYCKAGVRSRAAARVAKMAGWTKVGEYPGSWMDWEKNGGEVEK